MWMDKPMSELKERICSLSDEQLLNMVEVEFGDYRREAINFAKSELIRRGIDYREPSYEEELPPEKPINIAGDASRAETCQRCGGRTRHGVLFSINELTIFFSDRYEQRFLEVYACSRCRHIQVIVDLETDVGSFRSEATRTETSPPEPEGAHRCPRCRWEPDPAAEWQCDKCGCCWNTFQTYGRCPTCYFQWTETDCLKCGERSPHEDWYVNPGQGA